MITDFLKKIIINQVPLSNKMSFFNFKTQFIAILLEWHYPSGASMCWQFTGHC